MHCGLLEPLVRRLKRKRKDPEFDAEICPACHSFSDSKSQRAALSLSKVSQNGGDLVEKCHARIVAKQAQLASINSKYRNLNRQKHLKILQPNPLDLCRQYLAIEDAMESDISAYSVAWHLRISAKILTTLPRELRDMIYDSLLSPYPLIEIQKDSDSPWHKKSTSFPREASWLQPSHFGMQMVSEISERIFSRCVFQVKTLSIASWVMRTDMFDTGIISRTAIRALRIHILSDDYSTDVISKLPTIEPRAVGHLQTLLRIQKKAGFKLDFLVEATRKTTRKLMLALATFVFRFRKLGFVVRVIRWLSAAAKDHKRVWDLSAVYEGDGEECRARIEGFGEWAEVGTLVDSEQFLVQKV